MGGRLSPGRFLDCLLAEYDITVVELCRRSGLSGGEVLRILSDFQPVTPSLAEKLGLAFYSPGFWLVRQAMWEHVTMQHGE
jgi:antitoxin HigA-1